MRIPLGLVALPLLVIGLFGTVVSPDTVMQFIASHSLRDSLTIRLQSVVPYVVGNRSVGEIAITSFTLLVVKQCIDYFEKP
jgi:glucose uptake protein GlcU